MNNLKLRNKIFLILILPLLTIFALSSILFYDKYEEKNKIMVTLDYLDHSSKISELLHNLQKEREISLFYISSYGKEFINELSEKNKETDKILLDVEKIFSSLENKETSEKFKKAISKIKEIRNSIKLLQIDDNNVYEFYTSNINLLFLILDDLLAQSNSGKLSKHTYAFSSLVYVSEKAFLERNVLKNSLDMGNISNKDYYQFGVYLTAQNTYLDMFAKNANKNELDILRKLNDSSDFKEIERIRNIILYKNEKDSLSSSLKELAGFGGLIHNFKDFLLRGDIKYLVKVQQEHTNILRIIKKYKRIENITKEEKKLLKNIQRVFDSYLLYSDEISQLRAQDKTIEEVDSSVDVDDITAIESLESLSKNIFGATSKQWLDVSEKRLIKLRELEKFTVKNIKDVILEDSNRIFNELLFLVLTLILLLVLLFISVIFMANKISKSLSKFQGSLNEFFSYSMREQETIKLSEVSGTDEFAVMTLKMNEQISKIEKIIEKDKEVVIEISDVVEKVSNGFFEYSIHKKAGTNEVESLRKIINKMLDRTKLKIENINEILDSYTRGNYTFKLNDIQKKGMYGDFGILLNSTALLGQSSSELIAMITNAGKELTSNTQILAKSSNDLSISSQEQASSLEETAASLESITSNINSNSANINKMSKIADELNEASSKGSLLANETSSSMVEINQKVSAINDAISVIDKIAFQTNILSLNAAVEAATAGEAGKGFAVVAQEVRNLASRSAEAAKEIKDLVSEATSKAVIGKDVAMNMINGYDELSNKITETKSIIDEVTIFSKEQQNSIVQINTTINILDHATQKNASTAYSIDNLSKEVSQLSKKLLNITSQANIDEKYYSMVNNIELINDISKYKNDHISLKKKYFQTLDSFETSKIVDCQSCNMGKWLVQCENEDREFIRTSEWSKLKSSHEDVHNEIQKYLDKSSIKSNNKELRQIAENIENYTYSVFDNFNEIILVDSKGIDLQR